MRKFGRRLFKYGELTKTILTYLGKSLIDSFNEAEKRTGYRLERLVDLGVNFLKTLTSEDKKSRRKKVRNVIRRLEKRDIIDLKEENGQVYVYLKNKNHPKVIGYSIKALLDFKKKKKTWDGRWFIVFFDVPEAQRNKRDYLRKFLKRIGFYPYQQSVYIFPYECEKEVALIKKITESGKYLKYIIAEKIEEEEKIKTFFKIN